MIFGLSKSILVECAFLHFLIASPAGIVRIFASLAAYPASGAYLAGRLWIFASVAASPAGRVRIFASLASI